MNPDLVREILLQFEEEAEFLTPFTPSGVDTDDLPARLEELEQDGLLVLYKKGRGASGIFNLTMTGHDFAANARNEPTWLGVKEQAADLDRSASAHDVAELLDDYNRKRLGLPPKGL